MKTKHVILLCLIVSIFVFIVGYFAGWQGHSDYYKNIALDKAACQDLLSKDYKDVGGNIDIEYYLEVSEDSIWIENYNTHRVYGGKYTQLDSLINVDNL
ncbi:MAG: hypothetical protein ACKO6J_08355 [Crocinitomicaceae bacterium]